MQNRDLGTLEMPSRDALGPIPIFIIHRDRHSLLCDLIRSMHAIDRNVTDYSIVVHDMASSNPKSLKTLRQLARGEHAAPAAGVKVSVVFDTGVDEAMAWAVAQNLSSNDRTSILLNRVKATVDKHLAAHPEVQYYVVSDPDVALAPNTPGDVLALAALLLAARPRLDLVAPGIRTDDLPPHLCRSQLIQNHESGFWHGHAHSVKVNALRRYFSAPAPVDTTFALYRRAFPFRRLNLGARLHTPYVITHTPWYRPLSRSALTDEERYYIDHALPITMWTEAAREAAQREAEALTKRDPERYLDRSFQHVLRVVNGIDCEELRHRAWVPPDG